MSCGTIRSCQKNSPVPHVLTVISERERSWQTRHSVLQVPTRSFKDVLQILDNVHKEKKKDQNKALDAQKNKSFSAPQNPPRMGYSRYQQEIFNTQMNESHGFKIDTKSGGRFKSPLESPGHVAKSLLECRVW